LFSRLWNVQFENFTSEVINILSWTLMQFRVFVRLRNSMKIIQNRMLD
jgi:hypothetical protein